MMLACMAHASDSHEHDLELLEFRVQLQHLQHHLQDRLALHLRCSCSTCAVQLQYSMAVKTQHTAIPGLQEHRMLGPGLGWMPAALTSLMVAPGCVGPSLFPT